jgi:DNA-binding NtrC family response regulator
MLFGHVKGAFTGAHDSREGLVEQASHGTLFVDEFAEVAPEVQVMLLRLLERRSARRVGEVRERHFDVRFVAATNGAVDGDGATLRQDLLDRFGRLILRVPPLRERVDEIMPLARHFLDVFSEELHPPSPYRLTPAAEHMLVSATWPGNVRDLKATCRLAALLARPDGIIDVEALELPPMTNGPCMLSLPRTPEERRRAAREAMGRTGGNKARAAREMGLSRTSFYSWLNAS